MLTATLVMIRGIPLGPGQGSARPMPLEDWSLATGVSGSRAVIRSLCSLSAASTQDRSSAVRGKRYAPIALQRIETQRVFVGIRAVDRIVVVEAVDARAWSVAGRRRSVCPRAHDRR